MNSPPLLILTSIITLWVVHTILRFRNARRAFGGLTERSWFFCEASIIANVIPRFKFITVGVNWAMEDKYEPYQRSGWDVISSTSLFPYIRNVLVLADPALVKEIMLDRDRFSKFLEQYTPIKFYGDNIVASDGEIWKKYRKIAGPAFSERNNRLVWQETVRVMDQLFEIWSDRDSVAVDRCSEITMSAALSVLSAAGFGKRLSWHDDEAIPHGHKMTFRKAIEVATTEFAIKIAVPRWALGLTKRFRHVRDGFDDMHLYIKEMIEENQGTDMTGRDDLFSNFLKANNEDLSIGVQLNLQELIANTYMFLVAGIETTGHSLCFALALLALHPDVQEKAYQQICRVVPQGQMPTYDQMPSLTYTMAVFYETLRMFPPVSHIPKVALVDTSLTCTNGLGDKKTLAVAAGTPLTLNVAGLHYHPRYWEDPHSFKPERFLEDWPRDAFVPFSGGARSCIGRRFSETESVAFLTLIVSKYKISVTEEPEFSSETFEERKARVLNCTDTLTTTPIRVPLTFTCRS